MKTYIGIDHGYGFMKTVHHTFRTGVYRAWSEPTFLDHTVCLDGNYYIVGESGKAPIRDKTADKDYYVLTLAAIACELKMRGAGNKAEVILGVGLPFDYWQKQKEAFRKYLMQKKIAEYQYGGESYQIRILDVCVFPQGYAAIVEDIDKYRETHYLVDLGSLSMEKVCITNKIPVMTKSESIDKEIGLIYCLDLIKKELRKAYGQSFEDETLLEIMRKREKLLPQPFQELCEQVTGMYADQVTGILRQSGINPEYHRITWLGGGAQVMKAYRKFGNNVDFITNINANAKGYEFLCSNMKK